MRIEIDSDLHFKVDGDGCRPIVFVPDVNLFEIEDDSIIDSF